MHCIYIYWKTSGWFIVCKPSFFHVYIEYFTIWDVWVVFVTYWSHLRYQALKNCSILVWDSLIVSIYDLIQGIEFKVFRPLDNHITFQPLNWQTMIYISNFNRFGKVIYCQKWYLSRAWRVWTQMVIAFTRTQKILSWRSFDHNVRLIHIM